MSSSWKVVYVTGTSNQLIWKESTSSHSFRKLKKVFTYKQQKKQTKKTQRKLSIPPTDLILIYLNSPTWTFSNSVSTQRRNEQNPILRVWLTVSVRSGKEARIGWLGSRSLLCVTFNSVRVKLQALAHPIFPQPHQNSLLTFDVSIPGSLCSPRTQMCCQGTMTRIKSTKPCVTFPP